MRISDWSSDVCSSDLATSPLEGWSHYCATKAAVLMLTRCVDKEYRDRGIHVVGLSPGTVATDMQRAIRSDEHTSELQSLMRISYAVFCLKNNKTGTSQDFTELPADMQTLITHKYYICTSTNYIMKRTTQIIKSYH